MCYIYIYVDAYLVCINVYCVLCMCVYISYVTCGSSTSAPSHAENSVAAPTSLGDRRPAATILGTQKWSRLFQKDVT